MSPNPKHSIPSKCTKNYNQYIKIILNLKTKYTEYSLEHHSVHNNGPDVCRLGISVSIITLETVIITHVYTLSQRYTYTIFISHNLKQSIWLRIITFNKRMFIAVIIYRNQTLNCIDIVALFLEYRYKKIQISFMS